MANYFKNVLLGIEKRGYCKSAPNLKNVIPLIDEKCPQGYLRNKSFCCKNCKNDDRKK